MPKCDTGDCAGVVADEDEEEESDMMEGRDRKSVVEEGLCSTSIGSDDWRVKLGIVRELPWR